MSGIKVAAVQASYHLMDRDRTIARVDELCSDAVGRGAELVVFPEAFVPGNPLWIDAYPIWDDDDAWFALLAANTVEIPGPHSHQLGEIAKRHGIWLVVGVHERERHGGTIYNTVVTYAPDGELANLHRKLVPTGSERTVWGMGDGSTLGVVDMGSVRVGGLICWENYMPLARFHQYAQGVELWLAPTFATGDGWIATLRHIALENSMYVVGVNSVLHADQVPEDFPDRERLTSSPVFASEGGWLEGGNSVIVDPNGKVLAGPVRQKEEILVVDVDLDLVRSARRMMDPVGHYNRPDIFRLLVDTEPRQAVVETRLTMPAEQP
jgi:nitrilase